MKRCSTTYVIREWQIKAIRCNYTFSRMTEIQNTDNTNAYKDVEQPKPSFFAGGMQNGTATLDSSLAISYKANHGLTI